MLPPPETIQATIDQHALNDAAIAAIIRARPDVIAYAHSTLHDLGARVPFEITRILYACALQPVMFE